VTETQTTKSGLENNAAQPGGFEEKALRERKQESSNGSATSDPVEGLPTGKIGNIEISRVICGSNLFWGAAHAGELKYVSRLIRSYYSMDKIMDTLEICEENGINTNIGDAKMIDTYRKERGGKMQSITQVDPDNMKFNPDGSVTTTIDDIRKTIDRSVEFGAVGTLIVGLRAERYVKANRLDVIDEFIRYGKACGLITGVGAHDKQVPISCEEAGIDVDFYFKTIHHDKVCKRITRFHSFCSEFFIPIAQFKHVTNNLCFL